jgi:small subunit ribosomal protein S6e
MKLNISYPATGCQKLVEVEDEGKLRPFFDKRISHEVEGDTLGDDFKGYVFKISGGNDKQGFPMLQGVLTPNRVRLLFTNGMKCFRPRKRGERKRKSVRGCVVSSELSVLNLVIIKKGPAEIPGLTDQVKPRRLGPKRASKIRKLFNLTDKDDVRQYVIRRQIVPKAPEAKGGEEGEKPAPAAAPAKVKKPYNKAPKIQRLVTPRRLQHKRERKAIKRQRWEKSRKEAEEYNKLLALRMKEKRQQREAKLNKKRSLSRVQSQAEAAPAKAPAAAPAPAPAKKEAPKAEAAPKAAAPAKAAAKKDAPKAAAPKEAKGDAKKAAAPAKEAPKKAEPAKKPEPAKAPAKAEPAKKPEPAAKKPEPKKEAPKQQPKDKKEAPKDKDAGKKPQQKKKE